MTATTDILLPDREEFDVLDIKNMIVNNAKSGYGAKYDPNLFWEDYGKIYLQTFTMGDNKEEAEKRLQLNAQHLVSRVMALRPESVLEVGCGFGRLLPLVKGNAPTVNKLVGVELSQSMVDQHKAYTEIYKDCPLDTFNYTIQQGNAKNLPFEDKSFDLVYTHVVLTHIPPEDIAKVTSEIQRVAKKYILHFERFCMPYEHPNPHRWSHLLPPFYLDKGWELLENDLIHKEHFTTAQLYKRGE